MSREVINVGAAPNDGQGDPIRTSFIKTNNNFGELYARAQENPPATLVGTVGDVAGMYAYSANYFYYCYADYDGSSVIWAEIPNTVIDAIEIANGTSNVSIPTANGNVTVSVANVANVAVFSSGGANFTAVTASSAVINGDLTVTGNASLTGNVVGDRIVNGTTSVEIPVASGNATVTVGNIANVAVFTTSGITANVITAVGNITAANFGTAGVITATGNITGGNIKTLANVEAANLVGGNLVIPNGSLIKGDFTAARSAGRSVFQTTDTSVDSWTLISAIPGENNSNTLAAAFGAWSSANTTDSAIFGVYAYDNQAALQSLAVGSANVNPITFLFETVEVARFTPSGNLGIGNAAPVDPLAVTGTAYVSGNITGGNIVTPNRVSAGTLVVNGTSTFAGNLMPAANITYNLGNSTSRWNDIWLANSTIYLGNAQLSANATAINLTSPAGGTMAVSGSSGDISTGANVSATGTVIGGNITTSGTITATGNVSTSGLFIGNGSGLTGVVAVGNVGAASQFTNGTTSLNIPVSNGNIIGNIGGSTNLFEFSTVGLSAAGNITAGNINTAGVITATGNVTGGNFRTAGTMSATGNIITAGVFVGNGAGLTDVVGNIGSASQLTNGTTQINIPVAGGNIVANVAGSTNLFQWSTVGFSAQGNITGGNINTAGVVTATGNITGGNLVTAGLATVTGNVTGGNVLTGGLVSATGNITGNYLLGNGSQLSGIITSVANINSGTSIMEVVSSGGNIRANIGGTANVQVISSTGVFVTGLQSITGNVTAGNVLTGGMVSATGNITAGNLSVNTGTVSVGGILNNNANGVGNIGTTSTRFNTVFALASSAQYADLAEYYLADNAYPAGTIVAFGGTQELTRCDQDHDVTVAGIISDRPAFEMNAGIQGDNPVALALAGRVPCNVQGPVRRGDMLVSAGNGRARAETNPRMGAVIGKALEDFYGTTGTIEVVVGRI